MSDTDLVLRRSTGSDSRAILRSLCCILHAGMSFVQHDFSISSGHSFLQIKSFL